MKLVASQTWAPFLAHPVERPRTPRRETFPRSMRRGSIPVGALSDRQNWASTAESTPWFTRAEEVAIEDSRLLFRRRPPVDFVKLTVRRRSM